MPELFDSIAPQNAEIRTVTNSLPLNLKNSAKSLFCNRLSQTDENLKYYLSSQNTVGFICPASKVIPSRMKVTEEKNIENVFVTRPFTQRISIPDGRG